MQKKIKWTTKEINFLTENYPKYGIKFCLKNLKRTYSSILSKVYECKIESNRYWNDKNTKFLIENYPQFGSLFCSQKLNKTQKAIVIKAHKLGIKQDKTELSKRVSEYRQSNPKPDYKYNVNSKQFINFESPEAVYLLGFIWGDGHVRIRKNAHHIIFSNDWLDYLDLKHIFDKTGNWPCNFKKRDREDKCDKANICLSQKLLVKFLEENDYVIKSKSKPTKILSQIPEKLKHYFYLGWFDSDGGIHFSRSTKSVYYSSFYEQDWIDLENLFKSINVKFRINRNITKTGKNSSISFSNSESIHNLFKYLYKEYKKNKIGLKRKYKIFLEFFEYEKNLKKKKFKNSGSIYRGVIKKFNRFFVSIFSKGKSYYYSGFSNEIDAAKFYDMKAKELHGLKAKLNFSNE